jgi:CheY-like chemotaxis protein
MLNQSLKSSVGKPIRSTFRRILVVDDNQDAAESLAMLLSLSGDDTRIAYDGLEALQTAAVFRPDVIFVDLGLPKLNGYEVARKVRQSPGGDKMLLIALTGWTEDAVRHRSMAAGFDEYLIKPMDYFALASLLAGVEGVETAG